MIKAILILVFAISTYAAQAQVTINIYSPYDASGSGNPGILRVLQQANSIQRQFTFVYHARPGAQGLLAVEAMNQEPHSRLALINAAFVDNVNTGRLTQADYRAVHAVGDACWVVASTHGRESQGLASLVGSGELVVGTVGVGAATHLAALAIGRRYDLPVRLILYKSNNEALVQMAGGHGVNFVIERAETVRNMQRVNPAIQILAAACPRRLRSEPNIKTLAEQGIEVPSVFMVLIANQQMEADRQRAIGSILDQATRDVGLDTIMDMTSMRSPVFDSVTAREFMDRRITQINALQRQFARELDRSR